MWCFFFFFASPWQWEPTGVSVLFFLFVFVFPISVLVFVGMMSIPLLPHSSWLFPISQHCILFNINISWFLLLWQVNIYYVIFTKHCCMYMILSWLRLGSAGPCLYVFFFHPTRPKYREIKMEKQNKSKTKKQKQKNKKLCSHCSLARQNFYLVLHTSLSWLYGKF